MQLSLPDGRSLDVFSQGSSGPAIVFHHGTPGVGAGYPPWIAAAAEAGFRWVSMSRPGYGGSTRRPGRTVADNCSDVRAVLDHFEVDRFISVGWSGGGPHALACGALLAPRCAGVVALAAVAPYVGSAEAGLDWFDGMAPENLEEFGAAVAGERQVRAVIEPQRDQFTAITTDQVVASFGDLVDEVDRAVVTGEFGDFLAAQLRDAMRVSVDGWVDDDLAFAEPWGFEVADVRVPVAVWQGSDDRMVPFAHGPFLADRLPDVRAHLLEGEGHLSIPLARFHEVVAEALTFT